MLNTPSDTFFVTGGSGFIGRNILRALRDSGFKVKALARSDRSAQCVADLGAEPVMGDLQNFQSLKEGMRGTSHLIHTAADTNHGVWTKAQHTNSLTCARNVFSAAQAAKVRRVLHLSTEAVLLTGDPLQNADETMPIPRTHAGGYSRVKAAIEQLALELSNNDFEVIVVRPRFVWGRDDTTAMPQLIDAAQSGKLAWIGGGRYKISTTHIANVVAGIMAALNHGKPGEVYFISDGTPVIFREFITTLLATQGVSAPDKEMPRWLVASVARIGDMMAKLTNGSITGPMSWQEYATLGVEVTLNIEKARRDLNYAPVISIQEGLAELKATRA